MIADLAFESIFSFIFQKDLLNKNDYKNPSFNDILDKEKVITIEETIDYFLGWNMFTLEKKENKFKKEIEELKDSNKFNKQSYLQTQYYPTMNSYVSNFDNKAYFIQASLNKN